MQICIYMMAYQVEFLRIREVTILKHVLWSNNFICTHTPTHTGLLGSVSNVQRRGDFGACFVIYKYIGYREVKLLQHVMIEHNGLYHLKNNLLMIMEVENRNMFSFQSFGVVLCNIKYMILMYYLMQLPTFFVYSGTKAANFFVFWNQSGHPFCIFLAISIWLIL